MDKDKSDNRFTGAMPLNARIIAHLPNFAKLYWRLFRDPRVGWLPKIILVAGLAYLVIPTDVLPDILVRFAGLGLADDAIVLIVALKAFIKLCPRTVVEEHVRLIDEGG